MGNELEYNRHEDLYSHYVWQTVAAKTKNTPS